MAFILASRPAVAGQDQPVLSAPVTTVPQLSFGNSTSALEGASDIIIYIDPKTGAILKGPAAGIVPLRLTPLANAPTGAPVVLYFVSAQVSG